MEILNSVYNFGHSIGETLIYNWLGSIVALHESYTLIVIITCLIAGIVSLTVLCLLRCHRKAVSAKEQRLEDAAAASTRFRKRDKALFYGRKMLRKVKSISGQVRNSGQGKKRKMVMKFARRLLQLKKDTDTEQLKVLEPPVEYLQEEMLSDDRMPPDALYMLQSIRVFGHFEKPVFLKLCKHTEIINLDAGAYLFRIGDPDENVYIVQSGRLNVFITNNDNTTLSLKIVKPGESVTSLLSFTDVLTGRTNPYKTVSAKAIEDSTVVKLPMTAFNEIFSEYPDIFIRVIQVIMVRLQRVTFTALHQYLGLSAELVKPGPKSKTSKNPLFAGGGLGATSSSGSGWAGGAYNANGASPHKQKNREDGSTGASESSAHTLGNVASAAAVAANPPCASTSQPIAVPLVMGHKRSKSSLESTTSKSFSPNTPDIMADIEATSSAHHVAPDLTSLQRKRHSGPDNIDEDCLNQIAVEGFCKELGLDDDSLIQGKLEIKEVAAGTYVMKEDSCKDVALVYVISGALLVSQKMTESEESVHMFTAYHGDIVGGLAVLTGEPSFFTVRAKHFSRLALLPRTAFYNMLKERPNVVLYVAAQVVNRLSPFVRQVDFALDWQFVESGRAIYRQDDDSDSTYVVLSGRLRSVITHKNGKKELVGEYGKGDLIGVVEMVTHTKRSTTVIAVRDSELAKLPEGLFNAIKLRYPIVVTRLINLLGHRILGSWKKPSINVRAPSNQAVDSRPSQINFSTVAVVAASDDVPLTAFTYELYHCLCAIGPTLRLTSDIIRKTLGGPSIMDPNNEYRLSSWLAQQEDQHKISLYQCDLTVSAWTQRCIRQADCILIVGLGENRPTLGKVEKEVERLAMRTQKELVLLHREGGKPHNTVAWINMRSWVAWHHHILTPNRMFSRKSLYRINELYSKVCQSEPNVHSDFSRLARWLTGKSVGLVLGGGGARGSAHVGMIKAIQEAGIPIDMVGGVSIGAFMGALWCRERNITTMTQRAREWCKKMTQWWRQILDLTYPMTSMFSGRDFNQTIKGTFGDTYIEDLWLPYFTVTTDITASCMRVHSHGHLWRYVRSSMSIVGIFPPLCDPLDGHLLADGCYVNNVPADVMRSLGANHILAIDVGSVDDQDLTNYGDDLSGWWLLWKRWNPFTEPVKVPNLPDIQSRLAYVSCVRQLEEVKNSDYCEYIRPPIDKYRTLQFGSFDEIRDVGYEHGKEYFESQLKSGKFPIFRSAQMSSTTADGGGSVVCGRTAVQQHQQQSADHILSDYTFTDLAQMVCKVSRPYEESTSSSSSDEEYEDGHDGYASEPTVGLAESSKDKMLLHMRRAGGSLSLSENELESEVEFEMRTTINTSTSQQMAAVGVPGYTSAQQK